MRSDENGTLFLSSSKPNHPVLVMRKSSDKIPIQEHPTVYLANTLKTVKVITNKKRSEKLSQLRGAYRDLKTKGSIMS